MMVLKHHCQDKFRSLLSKLVQEEELSTITNDYGNNNNMMTSAGVNDLKRLEDAISVSTTFVTITLLHCDSAICFFCLFKGRILPVSINMRSASENAHCKY